MHVDAGDARRPGRVREALGVPAVTAADVEERLDASEVVRERAGHAIALGQAARAVVVVEEEFDGVHGQPDYTPRLNHGLKPMFGEAGLIVGGIWPQGGPRYWSLPHTLDYLAFGHSR